MDKIDNLLIYVAKACGDDASFWGKLDEILFLSDCRAFVRLGSPITDLTYEKSRVGLLSPGLDKAVSRMIATAPVPYDADNREMVKMLSHKRVTLKREADMSEFKPEEVAVVDEVVRQLRPLSPQEVYGLLGKSPGWTSAMVGEKIPISAALIPDEPIPPTPEEMDVARALGSV